MAIPIFEDFLYPFLLATNGKDMTVSEMREYIIDYFRRKTAAFARKVGMLLRLLID